MFHADYEHGVPSTGIGSLHGAGMLAFSVESAAESVGDLDPNRRLIISASAVTSS